MSSFLASLFWFLLFFGGAIYLAYNRVNLFAATVAAGAALLAYTIFGSGSFLWLLFLWLLYGLMVVPNLREFRREKITRPALRIYRTMLPSMSDTERDALEAGNVWWDGELFSGMPDWDRLMSFPAPRLSDEEQAFLDGPCEELCRMLDDWEISHERGDMPPDVWQFIKKHRFFAMIIPKQYGGLEFSAYANAMVITKLASRSTTASSTVGVPNSLGPAELLLHYGTEEQKQRYLPGLASGDEIPCFALTSPQAGSDAAAIIDSGVVCKGEWEGEEIVGIRLNWDKRYITLAPVATVLGLAFKLYDPDHLIGDQEEYGITAALIPTATPGVRIGRRHLPLSTPFQNGPTSGKDVFVPLDFIIGGREMAGKGWKMLVELLSVGRAITLPSTAAGGGQAAAYATGAYAQLRKQFNLPVARFEGVGEALTRIAGYTYIMNAAVSVTSGAIDQGEKPAVAGVAAEHAHRITFRGNQLRRNREGIRLWTRGISTLEYWPGYEVSFDFDIEGNLFEENLLGFNGSTGQTTVDGRSHDFRLRRNTFTNNRVGLRLERVVNGAIEGNRFTRQTVAAVQIEDSERVELDGNTFEDNATDTDAR